MDQRDDAATAPPSVDGPAAPREGRETAIRFVAVVAVIYATYWITWRWWYTINPDPVAIVPSLLLLLAETFAYVNMLLFVFMSWRLPDRDPGVPLEGRTVDVFITCYDEPLEVLRRTALGAKAIRYPHRTYMLDDGKREDVRKMAENLEIGYIRRVDNRNAKSGNLNHAIGVTSGEFILHLDADHVPLPNIVHRMLGYFRDPLVAMVQSPQDFYNTDSFTHVVHDEGRRLWEENRIFYSLIQRGRDNWNASFFCGSCGIMRRAALEEIGGFQTQTIIEDMETTIELHSRGWKSVYHAEPLAYGLSPGAAGAYHVQRLRWGQGAMQVMRKLKPLTRRGLTLPQRINYFAGTWTYFEGWQKLIFYLTPLLYLYTGLLPISASETGFIIRLVPYLVLGILAFELLSRGTGYLLYSERFTMVRFYTYMLAVTALFSRKPLKFMVTPKGKSGVPPSAYVPQLILFILSLGGLVWATLAYSYGWVDYRAAGWNSVAFWVTGMWAVWNCYFAGSVVHHTLATRHVRDDHRFVEHLMVQIRAEDAPGVSSGLTEDINPAGAGFRSVDRFEPGTRISLRLPLATREVTATGSVVYAEEQRTAYGPVHRHGVRFEDLPMDVRDAIEIHCTHHAVPIWREKYRQSVDIVTRAGEVMSNNRGRHRRLVQLPAHVRFTEGNEEVEVLMILEEISSRGARVVGERPLTPGTRAQFHVPGTDLSGSGTIRFSRALETPMSVRFSMGMEFDDASPSGRGFPDADAAAPPPRSSSAA